MPAAIPLDRLSALLEQFRVRTELFYSGSMCGLQVFDAVDGCGYLHVLRRGSLSISHRASAGLPARLQLSEPSLLFYPRPVTHRFHNPPQVGSDFTCARLDFQGGAGNPLARALPPLIVLPLAQVDGLESALALLFAETDQVRCGQRLLADRLFEVVLIKLLRWLVDHPENADIQPGLMTGLAHPRLAKALVAMHESPGATWTIERLASCAGMSRTVFASSFKEVVGQSPADYLSDWRISLMQKKLREGVALKLISDQLGYANPSALSRTFSAKTGMSPRQWLQSQA